MPRQTKTIERIELYNAQIMNKKTNLRSSQKTPNNNNKKTKPKTNQTNNKRKKTQPNQKNTTKIIGNHSMYQEWYLLPFWSSAMVRKEPKEYHWQCATDHLSSLKNQLLLGLFLWPWYNNSGIILSSSLSLVFFQLYNWIFALLNIWIY